MAWILAKLISDTKPLRIYFLGVLLSSNQQQRDLRNEVFARCSCLDSALNLFRHCLWLLAIRAYSPELNHFAVHRIRSCGNRSTVAAKASLHFFRKDTNDRGHLRVDFSSIRGTRFPAADLD